MPLRLRTLTLGLCLLPWSGDDCTSAAWLCLLADLSALESAHVHNCEVVINNIIECLDLYESDRSGLGWATFSPRLTPHLCRLTAYRCHAEILEVLDTWPAGFLWRVFVGFQDTEEDASRLALPAMSASARRATAASACVQA